MTEIKKILASKTEEIFNQWKDKVRKDRNIESSKDLSETALGNSVLEVLEAMVTAIDETTSDEDDFEKIAQASLEHGTHRSNQGYDAAEIAREYHLLRQTIFSSLAPDLLRWSFQEAYRVNRLIDAVVDGAITQCFNQFVEEQMFKQEEIAKHLTLNNQELNRLLSLSEDNLAQLAHEIKTPLNSIMGYSQLLLRDAQAKNTKEKVTSIDRIERVIRSSRQLLQLVNDSLETSRYSAGKNKLQLVSINVCSVINQSIEIIEPLAEAKSLKLETDCDRAPEQVITDPSCLRQILTNLLSNAIRYTDQGFVRVSCESLADAKWSLTVSDTGIGINPEEQASIFEPFSRSSTNQNREGSTGLGLTIVARIVEVLQGKIELVSEVGKGSQFILVFPLEVNQ